MRLNVRPMRSRHSGDNSPRYSDSFQNRYHNMKFPIPGAGGLVAILGCFTMEAPEGTVSNMSHKTAAVGAGFVVFCGLWAAT